MGSSKVSILIPVYNRPDLIRRAVRCALSQTHGNIEVVIIDNCSTDNTWEVVKQLAAADSRVRCLRNTSNLGPLRSWRRGLDECRGDYIKILWSDDWIDDEFVADCLKLMHDQPAMGLVFTATLVHFKSRDQSHYIFPDRNVIPAKDYVIESLTLGNQMPVSPGCSLVRRDVAQFQVEMPENVELQRLAERTGAGADLLFLLNAAARSEWVGHVPRYLSHFLASDTSITCNHGDDCNRAYELARKYFVDYLQPADWDFAFTKEVAKVVQPTGLKRIYQSLPHPIKRIVKRSFSYVGLTPRPRKVLGG
ncbi:MAG: glycosyltransferase family 2 protein [Planctomycetes bacterium]|nr:glycosyltransferase family 2 protein [Planctomycetota bacterium]